MSICGHAETRNSRVSEEGDAIHRRRRCLSCDKRFTTYERVELAMPSIVKRSSPQRLRPRQIARQPEPGVAQAPRQH